MELQGAPKYGLKQRIRRPLKKLFRMSEEQSNAERSSPIIQSSASDVQVTQPFPVGIKEWVKCDTADVDICFVHGLTGNRDSTWTAKGQIDPWPKTLLASELSSSTARIFTYGYDAYTIRTGATAKTRMTDHAIDFLQKVTANRAQNSALDRPLIIIAHSLGGLVSKQAILKSQNSAEPHLRNLYNMTEGIMFLGTPHTGAWMARWAKITVDVFGILKSTNSSLLDTLQTRNELLLSLNQDFLTLLRTLREGPEHGKKINVICFFEAYGYPGIGQIVPKESATFAFDLPISINANHSEMVKFGTTNDDGYQSVVAELASKVTSLSTSTSCTTSQNRVEVILQLFDLPNTEDIQEAMRFCLKTLDLEEDASLLQTIWAATGKDALNEREIIGQRVKAVYRGAAERCRLSLTFKDMMVREEFVANPQNETCRWIYHDRQYKEWITNRKPLLWIKAGNPGSGKSILMKSLYKQRKQDLKGSQTVLLRFFFNARGSDMEKSREALYKTLLLSLIQESRLMLCEVLALYLEKETRGNIVQWQTPELVDVFHDKIEHFRTSDIEILIDALDECSEAEVLRVVRRFEESIQVPRNHTTLRVCWSSRFYPHISLRAVQGTELVVNNNNSGDIRQYVQSILPIDSHKPLRSVSEDIIARAQGNFLWASLVSDKLIKAFHTGKGVNELKDTLRNTPDGLDNYFLEVFKAPSFTEEQRHDLQRIALFVLGASRSLSVEELHTALILENPSPNLLLGDITFQSEDIERFKKHLTHVSGGLIEVANIKKLLHQTIPPDHPSYQSSNHSSGQIDERPASTVELMARESSSFCSFPIIKSTSRSDNALGELDGYESSSLNLSCVAEIGSRSNRALEELDDWESPSPVSWPDDETRSELDIASGNELGELSDVPDTRVQVIHESVREFFLGKGLPILQASSRERYLISCDCGITRAGFNGLSKIATESDTTKHFQDDEYLSINNEALNFLIAQRSWYPPWIPFLENYIMEHVFAHLDRVRLATVSESAMNTLLPPATIRQQAFYTYLRVSCFEVIRYCSLKVSREQQLRVISRHADAFEFDDDFFHDLIDLPKRLMAGLEFLRRRKIYLSGDISSTNPHSESQHRFFAIFLASFQHPFANFPLSEVLSPILDNNVPSITPGTLSLRGGSESSRPLFGISFLVPASVAPQLMLPGRLSGPDLRTADMESEDGVEAVNINNWQVVSVADPNLQSLLPKYEGPSSAARLTSFILTCRLFHWASTEDAPSGESENSFVFIQEGQCALSWEQVKL
ncbi:hypothetical protein FHL15_010141 [Xylaria flabelliformis]|uniref:NACHT domain-containing protein n=1 Tax=Xylaria flabelliformis TaxID=2512241 RepID=A0A553HLT3_9PEZI|nr:hypothetical protein FHL15_010141 [Xylaria flabelliformis]